MISVRVDNYYRNEGNFMNRPELWENTEELRNAINVLQLLMTELTANYDAPHILRSVGIAEGMLQAVLSNLQQLKTE